MLAAPYPRFTSRGDTVATLTADEDGVVDRALDYGRKVEACLVDAGKLEKVTKRIHDSFANSWRMQKIPVSAEAADLSSRVQSFASHFFIPTHPRTFFCSKLIYGSIWSVCTIAFNPPFPLRSLVPHSLPCRAICFQARFRGRASQPGQARDTAQGSSRGYDSYGCIREGPNSFDGNGGRSGRRT